MKKRIYRTDILFPKNSFHVGMGNIGNLSGNYFTYNMSSSDEEADVKALSSDWGVIGKSLQKAIKIFCKKFNIQ